MVEKFYFIQIFLLPPLGIFVQFVLKFYFSINLEWPVLILRNFVYCKSELKVVATTYIAGVLILTID